MPDTPEANNTIKTANAAQKGSCFFIVAGDKQDKDSCCVRACYATRRLLKNYRERGERLVFTRFDRKILQRGNNRSVQIILPDVDFCERNKHVTYIRDRCCEVNMNRSTLDLTHLVKLLSVNFKYTRVFPEGDERREIRVARCIQ